MLAMMPLGQMRFSHANNTVTNDRNILWSGNILGDFKILHQLCFLKKNFNGITDLWCIISHVYVLFSFFTFSINVVRNLMGVMSALCFRHHKPCISITRSNIKPITASKCVATPQLYSCLSIYRF